MISKVLKILALIAFVLASFEVHVPVNLIALGLTLWVGSQVV